MEDLTWKVLSSEYIVKDEWCNIRKERCETPGGKIVEPYYVYEFTPWAAGLGITLEGKAVMIRQYRHGIGETIIELPGGCVDATDSTPQKAMEREMLEETGYTFSHYEYLGRISPNPSTNSNVLHMFMATGGVKTHSQQLDHNEEIEVMEMSIDELKQLVRENKIIQGMHVSCILYALARLGELKY